MKDLHVPHCNNTSSISEIISNLNRLTSKQSLKTDDLVSNQTVGWRYTKRRTIFNLTIFGNDLYVNHKGDLSYVNIKNGNELWEIRTTNNIDITSHLHLKGEHVLFSLSDDRIYYVNRKTGEGSILVDPKEDDISIKDGLGRLIGIKDSNLYYTIRDSVWRSALKRDLVCYDFKREKVLYDVRLEGDTGLRAVRVYNNNVYVNCGGGVFCIDNISGEVVWQKPHWKHYPINLTDKYIFTRNENKLYCLDNSNGKKEWEINFGEDSINSVIIGDSIIFCAVSGGKLIALLKDSRKVLNKKIFEGEISLRDIQGRKIYVHEEIDNTNSRIIALFKNSLEIDFDLKYDYFRIPFHYYKGSILFFGTNSKGILSVDI